jgi:Protein of unknown function (DUF2975)
MSPSPVFNHLQRIQRVSRIMVRICLAMVVLMPLALVIYWATASAPELATQGNLQASVIRAPLQIWQRVAATLVSGVPLACLLIGVWQAKLCFAQFAKGDVFTASAVGYLRRFAGWTAAAALAAIVAGAAISILLTINNPPGTRQLALGISSNQVFTLFFAALVWLMADVIGQGQALADENQQFV